LSHDAAEQSLAARIRSLSLAPDLRDILAELAERTEHLPPAHAAEYKAMLERAHAGAGEFAGPPRRHPKHKHQRDRHGMYAIPGGLAAIAAAALLAWRVSWKWAAKSGAHKAAAATVAAAMAGAAVTVPVAVAYAPYGSPITPATSVTARHMHSHQGPAPAPWPSTAPPRRRRRHDRDADLDADRQRGRTITTPSPSPSPVPSPSPTFTPVPTPSASGPLGQLLGPLWPNMLQHGMEVFYVYPAR
jgi:hypothetical protein